MSTVGRRGVVRRRIVLLRALELFRLLQGLGAKVNGRNIRVARRNMVAAQQTFRSQLLNLVAGVLNLYWDLVTDNDDLKARQRARLCKARYGPAPKNKLRGALRQLLDHNAIGDANCSQLRLNEKQGETAPILR